MAECDGLQLSLDGTWGLPDIDEELVDLLVRHELRDLWAEYEEPCFSLSQQLRTFAIEWLAVFVPWRVSSETAALIEGTVEVIRARKEYMWSDWHRSLPLDLALFALTNEHYWLEPARANVDHHNSTLRLAALESLALVADSLDFRDDELQGRVKRGLRAGYFYSELGLLILAAAQGPLEEKRELFRTWQALNSTFGRRMLADLVSGTPVQNEFSEHIAWVTTYTLLRLGQVHALRQDGPLTLPLLPSSDPADMETRLYTSTLFKDVAWPSWLLARIVSRHPLAAATVTLESLQ